jgi:predicted dehydrogenase
MINGSSIVVSLIWEGDETPLTTEHDGVVNDFVEAILQKRKPQTTLQDALLFARLADAIYASSAVGRAVTFD